MLQVEIPYWWEICYEHAATGLSWQEGWSKSGTCCLQQCWAEKHLGMHNTTERTMLGPTPVSYEPDTLVAEAWTHPNWTAEDSKQWLVRWISVSTETFSYWWDAFIQSNVQLRMQGPPVPETAGVWGFIKGPNRQIPSGSHDSHPVDFLIIGTAVPH